MYGRRRVVLFRSQHDIAVKLIARVAVTPTFCTPRVRSEIDYKSLGVAKITLNTDWADDVRPGRG